MLPSRIIESGRRKDQEKQPETHTVLTIILRPQSWMLKTTTAQLFAISRGIRLTFGVDQWDGFQRGRVQQVFHFVVRGLGGDKFHLSHHDVLNHNVVLAAETEEPLEPK